MYAGGGTSVQIDAGVEDSVENMCNYIIQEVGDVVSKETVRRFCKESPSSIEWLKERGVQFKFTWTKRDTVLPNTTASLLIQARKLKIGYDSRAIERSVN